MTEAEAAECPFCPPKVSSRVLLVADSALLILTRDVVAPGQMLAVPMRHVERIEALTAEERSDLIELGVVASESLHELFEYRSFNYLVNSGHEAGQTIPHAHLHVVPRVSGDVPDPYGWPDSGLRHRLRTHSSSEEARVTSSLQPVLHRRWRVRRSGPPATGGGVPSQRGPVSASGGGVSARSTTRAAGAWLLRELEWGQIAKPLPPGKHSRFTVSFVEVPRRKTSGEVLTVREVFATVERRALRIGSFEPRSALIFLCESLGIFVSARANVLYVPALIGRDAPENVETIKNSIRDYLEHRVHSSDPEMVVLNAARLAAGNAVGDIESILPVKQGGWHEIATGGCFDGLHEGHRRLLALCRQLCVRLVVYLATDDDVRRQKGHGRPLFPYAERAAELAREMRADDVVTPFDIWTAVDNLERLRPDLYVKGRDYWGASIPEAQAARPPVSVMLIDTIREMHTQEIYGGGA